MAFTNRVFSGMQPTGNLHLGNYLGALVRWVEMQSTHECIYCIVDMHAITASWQDPKELRQAIRDVTASYIAAGLDPKKSILFNQSQVPAHAELAWIFNCTARLGWLDRMTQFKDKAGKDKERSSVGLYAYPVLMASDILVYHATHVPVGEDQKQHLELTRDIAQKFNIDYKASIADSGQHHDGQFFPLPEPVIVGPATRVMSLRDGTKKMSKSDVSDLSRINMTDDAETIARKIQKAKTDAEGLPSEEAGLAGRPEADNLVGIYAALTGMTKADVLAQYGGGQFSGFKKALGDVAVAKVSPVNAEMRRLLADPAEIDRILADGSERAQAIAGPIVRQAKEIVGFLQR
jgi:tryptophanyl-tRNA synthetase